MQPDAVWRSLSASASFSIDKAAEGVRKPSVTFRVTSLLGIQQRWASLQRAPVAGVPYLLALSKSSLNGVLGVECSNHSVPTILFNDLGQCPPHWPFSFSGDFRGFSAFHPCLLFKIVRTGPRESVADTIFAASISCPSSAPE